MQTVSTKFNQLANGQVRPLKWEVRASFDKDFDEDVNFFELNTSLLNGGDVLAPSNNSVIQEWDKYKYINLSDRVISVEVESEQTEPYSVVQSMADITFNNYDNFFTPKSGSAIQDYILPRRPFRILMGFGNETVPLFVGLSTKLPEINKQSRTARFHCIDFLTYLFEQKIDNTVMLQDYSTGEILSYLLEHLGLLPSQYDIDPVSFNRINFFYVEKGATFGSIVRPLMQAEQGRLWMDELGIIRFLNRQNYPTTSVISYDESNVVDYDPPTDDDVINYAKITAKVLEEQDTQKLPEIAEVFSIPAGGTYEYWFSFSDPVTEINTPTYSATEIEDSFFTASLDKDGTLPYADVVLDSIDVFNKSAKLVFQNTGSSLAFVTGLVLWGKPVKVIDVIEVEESDQDSIDALELRPYEFETNYIQDRNDAVSKVSILVDDYKDVGSVIEFQAKGNPAVQIGDIGTIDLDGFQGDHVISKVINIMSIADGYTQRIRATHKDPRTYFILNQSLLNGSDVLSP